MPKYGIYTRSDNGRPNGRRSIRSFESDYVEIDFHSCVRIKRAANPLGRTIFRACISSGFSNSAFGSS